MRAMTDGADIASIPLDLLSEAVDALEEGIAIYDANERLVTFNRRYRELLGPMGDMVEPGMAWRDLIHGCVERGLVSEHHESGRGWEEVSEEQRKSGAKHTEIRQLDGRFFEISYHPTRSGGFVVTRTDVTDRHEAEQRAAERERLLTAILETNPIPVVMARVSDGEIVYHSPAAAEMLSGVTDSRNSYYEPEARAEYIRMLKEHGKVENFYVKRQFVDGSVQNMSLSGALTEYGGELCVVSSVSNMTEIRRREALIRRVVEACPAPVLMNRATTGEILYRSPKVEELFGTGEKSSDYWADHADRAPFLKALRERGEVADWRGRFLNAEGEVFHGAISARIIEWSGEEVIVSHTRDLTQELAIEAELDRQRQQGFQNEKMMALGGLMAGVAHELNNPLSVVVGHAMILQDEIDDPDVLRKMQKISDAAERCAKIVKAFLTMARQDPVRMERTDLNEVIDTAVEVASYGDALGSAARVEMSLDSGLAPVLCDADQITQVVINLVLNAAQALGESGGHIRVTSARTGDQSQIIVEDNGPGVSDDVRARIFEPFFTTKGVGKGTGIGLAMCHRIVTAHKGTITLETPSAGGARFVVSLPAAATAQAEPETPAAEANPTMARVLVIDDEPDVADINAEILSRAGFEAEVVYRAADFLARLEDGRFDAVLSDLNMPDLDGRGVFEAIRARQPDLVNRTGFLTGDTMGRQSQAFLGEVKRPYIEKPVSPKELRAFVGRLVSGEM